MGMKKLLFILALLLTMAPVCVQPSAFTPYPQYDDNSSIDSGWGRGGRPKPVVPEPEIYGAIFTGLALSFLSYKRFHYKK
jgi:hypothetical protein